MRKINILVLGKLGNNFISRVNLIGNKVGLGVRM